MRRLDSGTAILAVLPLLLAAAAARAQDFRTERDLLGEKQVPAEAYYGVQTARALEIFEISGRAINAYPELVRALVVVKLAAARANHEAGALDAEELRGIEQAAEAILRGEHRDQFAVDLFQGDAGTSTNMNANEVLANLALEADDLISATWDLHGFVVYSSALRSLAVKLGKLASDLILLSSGPRAGLFEINLPPLQPGSSIMPGKVNPVIPELSTWSRSACWPTTWRSPSRRAPDGISANPGQLQMYMERSIGIVTALNPVLGYDRATELAAEALKTNKGLLELVREKGLLSDEQIEELLDPRRMTGQ